MEVPTSPEQRVTDTTHLNEPRAIAHRQLQLLIQEGIDSPAVPAEKAFARLREIARRLASQ